MCMYTNDILYIDESYIDITALKTPYIYRTYLPTYAWNETCSVHEANTKFCHTIAV